MAWEFCAHGWAEGAVFARSLCLSHAAQGACANLTVKTNGMNSFRNCVTVISMLSKRVTVLRALVTRQVKDSCLEISTLGYELVSQRDRVRM